MKWQIVDSGLERAEIPGGWLMRHYINEYSKTTGWHQVVVAGYFVPDPEHIWKL
jgi:hypothetical protein